MYFHGITQPHGRDVAKQHVNMPDTVIMLVDARLFCIKPRLVAQITYAWHSGSTTLLGPQLTSFLVRSLG